MIPDFTETGMLPPGIHDASLDEFKERYGYNAKRKALISGLDAFIDHMKSVNCKRIYVDGSFVTNKENPNDYDACWDVSGVKIELLDPILISFDDVGKNRQQVKYGGDIRPESASPVESNESYLGFFQIDRDGNPKGIVCINL